MAVYTDVAAEDLHRLLEGYPLGALVAYRGIREGVENSNFVVETERARVILTIYEKRVDAADLPFFLGLMQHLAERGFPCPSPIHAHDGAILRTLKGKPAAIVSFLEGTWPRRITPERCAALGAVLAHLHVTGGDLPLSRLNALAQAGWQRLFQACAAEADTVERGLADELDQELVRLSADWPDALPVGVIHADLFPDNVFFAGDVVTGVIDFYFACNDLLAYDLGICLNAWCFEPDASFNVTKAKALLEGYRKVRPLVAEEVAALPVLARGAAVRFLLTRLYDWLNQIEGALVRPKDPREYLRKLRFHRSVRGPADYGL